MLLWIILLISLPHSNSIQNRIISRPVKFAEENPPSIKVARHVEAFSRDNFNWEKGLREATVQALLKEHLQDRNLREHIYSAPLLGKENKATPFGDVALLARGQLYANYAGYVFVQDPYQNGCDDCYGIDKDDFRKRCIMAHCQIAHPRKSEQLVTLWSIKRIRHRNLKDGLDKLEVEFSILPVGLRYSSDTYVTKEGTFNYNLPGHVFILKSSESYPNLDNKLYMNHHKQGAFVAQTSDGRKFVLHRFSTAFKPQIVQYPSTKNYLPITSTATTQYSEENNAKKLYQTLLEALHKKTSLEPNRMIASTQQTGYPISATTLVQFPDGQVVPITELQTTSPAKTTPGYVTVKFPETVQHRPTLQTTTNGFVPTVPQQTATMMLNDNVYATLPKGVQLSTSVYSPPSSTATSQIQPLTNGFVPTVPQRTTIMMLSDDVYATLPKVVQPQVYSPPSPTTTAQIQPLTDGFVPTIRQQPTTMKFGNDDVYATLPKKVYSPSPSTATSQIHSTSESQTTTRRPVMMTFHFFGAEADEETSVATTESSATTLPSTRPAKIIKVTKAETTVPQTTPATSSNTFYHATNTASTRFTMPITVVEETSSIYSNENETSFSTTPNEETTTSTNAASTHFQSPVTSLQTTLMQISDNKTTFYAAEETESSASPITEPTIGRTSGRTTPTYDNELFGLVRKPSKTTKPSYKTSTTEAGEFLVDDKTDPAHKVPLYKKPPKDYSDDDIFGAHAKIVSKQPLKSATVKEYKKSDIETELFDKNNRRGKSLLIRSTTGPATETDQEEINGTMPVTSQSFLTSISYEVNRKKNRNDKKLATTTHDDINEHDKNRKVGDEVALRLLSQARGVAYLDESAATATSASTVASTSAKTTKKSKYVRKRTYLSRTQRLNRKKHLKNNNRQDKE